MIEADQIDIIPGATTLTDRQAAKHLVRRTFSKRPFFDYLIGNRRGGRRL